MSHGEKDSVGARIREIRGSLGVGEFALALDVNRKTVTRWEADEALPDGASLLSFQQKFGADPGWILTGKGPGLELTPDERELLALFRSASLSVKAAAVGALKGGGAKISVGGSITGQVAEGGLVNHGAVTIKKTTGKGRK